MPLFRFPEESSLLKPVRRNIDGEKMSGKGVDANMNQPYKYLLRGILVDKADWYITLSRSIATIQASRPQTQKAEWSQDYPYDTILLLGQVECPFPRTLLASLLMNFRFIRSYAAASPLSYQAASPNHLLDDARPYAYPKHSIAIIGASCRFSESETLSGFWETIRTRNTTRSSPPTERGLGESTNPNQKHRNSLRASFLRSAASFDNEFFGDSPRRALYTDPQHRLALQLAYQALESSGYFSPTSDGRHDVGCYLGLCWSEYDKNVNFSKLEPSAFSYAGTARGFCSGRINHFFNFTGPNFVVDAACASSSVAIHLGARSILAGECSMALAGAINLIVGEESSHNLRAASFTSPGAEQCRPFDVTADGYTRGEGGGIVVLKRLEEAVASHDCILGVLTASAMNSSGFESASITAPSAEAQSRLHRQVLGMGQIHPNRISYVEAHAAGTQQGDLAEMRAIRDVYVDETSKDCIARRKRKPLQVGSVKSNIGHTEASSGVGSLLKVLLMLQTRRIPPQPRLRALNQAIERLCALDDDAVIEIPTVELKLWDESFRAACVNNFGAQGTNVALLVCQPPPLPVHLSGNLGEVCDYGLPFLFTAHSPQSLRLNVKSILKYLDSEAYDGHTIDREQQAKMLGSIAFHLAQRQNHRLPYRATFMASTIQELKVSLCSHTSQDEETGRPKPTKNKPVILVFSGQTGHTPLISEQVYQHSDLLRRHLNRCDRVMQSLGLESIFPYIFEVGADTEHSPTPSSKPQDLARHHCTLFAIQYSIALSWLDAGLEVSKMVGHSLGQLVALCVGGFFSLHDAFRVVSGRAKLIQDHWRGEDKGCMLMVHGLDTDKIRALMDEIASKNDLRLEIACYNASHSHVLAGHSDAASIFEDCAIGMEGVRIQRLPISHAFHSHMVDAIIPEYVKLLRTVQFLKPSRGIAIEPCCIDPQAIRIWSSTTGEHTLTPEMVARQTREPVYFSHAVQRIQEELGACIWLEAGAASYGTTNARRALFGSTSMTLPTSSGNHVFAAARLDGEDALKSLVKVTKVLWEEGVSVQFWPFHPCQRSAFSHHTLYQDLPPYQFNEVRHWVLPTPSAHSSNQGDGHAQEHGEVGNSQWHQQGRLIMVLVIGQILVIISSTAVILCILLDILRNILVGSLSNSNSRQRGPPVEDSTWRQMPLPLGKFHWNDTLLSESKSKSNKTDSVQTKPSTSSRESDPAAPKPAQHHPYSPEDVSVRAKLKEIIHEVADVPSDMINDDTTLFESGLVDSLVAIELRSEIHKVLGILLPLDTLYGLSFGGLAREITSKREICKGLGSDSLFGFN